MERNHRRYHFFENVFIQQEGVEHGLKHKCLKGNRIIQLLLDIHHHIVLDGDHWICIAYRSLDLDGGEGNSSIIVQKQIGLFLLVTVDLYIFIFLLRTDQNDMFCSIQILSFLEQEKQDSSQIELLESSFERSDRTWNLPSSCILGHHIS